VHVRGTCQDDDPAGCATVLVTDCPSGTYETRTIAGSVIDVFVRPCGGGFGTITLVATDFAGQQTLRSIEGITTETSPTLRAVATVGGRILDARDERILYTRNYLGSNPEMWIYNFVRGTEERVCLSSEARKNPTIGSIQEALTRCLSQHKARSQTRPSASRPASPNQVRQLGHVSTDGGKTWTVSFDLTYVRKPPKA